MPLTMVFDDGTSSQASRVQYFYDMINASMQETRIASTKGVHTTV